jgi:hypothetical protein
VREVPLVEMEQSLDLPTVGKCKKLLQVWAVLRNKLINLNILNPIYLSP